jgi:hypothetical protein
MVALAIVKHLNKHLEFLTPVSIRISYLDTGVKTDTLKISSKMLSCQNGFDFLHLFRFKWAQFQRATVIFYQSKRKVIPKSMARWRASSAS